MTGGGTTLRWRTANCRLLTDDSAAAGMETAFTKYCTLLWDKSYVGCPKNEKRPMQLENVLFWTILPLLEPASSRVENPSIFLATRAWPFDNTQYSTRISWGDKKQPWMSPF
jgi:hypothetical protein